MATQQPTAVKRHGARAALYGGLAAVFAYPTDDRIGEVRDAATLDALATAATRLGHGDAGEDLTAALSAASVADLQAVHDDLFGVPDDGGTYRVVPYEANYTVRDDVGQKQRRIATVAGVLDALNLERSDEFADRRDHVAVELELLQVLAAQHALAAERDEGVASVERAAGHVVHEHLTDFVGPLAHDVRAATDDADRDDAALCRGSRVYRAAARLAERLVADDADRLPEPALDGGGATAKGGDRT